MTIQSERVDMHYLINSRVVIYVQCWKDSNMAYWLCQACSIGRWRWWRCLIRNWTHNGQFGKLLQQLLLGRVEMRRNMREYSSARIVNIFFISMHLCAQPMAAIHVFPAKTPWKEKYMKILVVDWLLWGLCMKIPSQTLHTMKHQLFCCILPIYWR